MLYPRGVIVREIHAAHYRSLRSIRFPTGRLTVFVGANGVGKTNLYRAVQLLQASAAGTLAREIAAEGGMQSALWAGKRRATSRRASSCPWGSARVRRWRTRTTSRPA
jgi:predicted ATPase